MNSIIEFDFITWAQKYLGDDKSVKLHSGDDTAILKTTPTTALTTDALVDQVHFDLSKHKAGDIGKKAINVNVSDIAAMGMQPSHCVITFCVPKKLSLQKLKAIFLGMIKACQKSNLTIVGGDFTRSPGPLMINVAMTGRPIDGASKNPPITRSGAKVGHKIYVTGLLGGSIYGKHLCFEPRLAEIKALLSIGRPSSMIDISDGLSSEINHICNKSNVGAKIDGRKIPISTKAKKLKPSGLMHALHDGEDFELLFTVSPTLVRKIEKQWNSKTQLTQIGVICDKKEGVRLFDNNQYVSKLVSGGWVH